MIAYIHAELERLEQEIHDFVREYPARGDLELMMPWERSQDPLCLYFELAEEDRMPPYLNLFAALAQLDPVRWHEQLSRSVVGTAFDLRRSTLLS